MTQCAAPTYTHVGKYFFSPGCLASDVEWGQKVFKHLLKLWEELFTERVGRI